MGINYIIFRDDLENHIWERSLKIMNKNGLSPGKCSLKSEKKNYFSKIVVTSLMLILCALMVPSVSATGYNVLNTDSPVAELESELYSSHAEEYNVLSPVPSDYSTVLNPGSASYANILSESQISLVQGQNSPVYRVTLNCPGTVRLSSSYGARFNLYAKKNQNYGSCPSASSLRYNYDKVAYGYSGSAVMNLDPGVWCIMVYGYSGSGSYSLRVTTTCSQPTPTPTWTPYPTPSPEPCGVYRTDSRQVYLNQGQAAVYGYSIPNDGRSKIEWSMTSSGSCGGDTPIIIASVDGNTLTGSSSNSGSSVFDLYIFKDCNPKNSQCYSNYHSYGPNSYVSIANPSRGSIYYAMVYARTGCGTFNLKMNSYKCTGWDTPIIMSSADVPVQASAGAEDSGSGQEVTAPPAEYVLTGDAGE
ncbi:MAG: hypothetical protein CVV33_06445 [Methanomicrobiales archaeon HGW-Methanomicrobiales-4]|nr:MAG: hypothetical protein CVV33_06445 [Methanomicrobiales archaeon HGW-Methanomicrobiales-4]